MPRKSKAARQVRILERKLGFYTERGLQRSGKSAVAQSPHVRTMLKGIDKIKKDYVDYCAEDLRSSLAFEKDWRDLFWDVGFHLWPEVDGNPVTPEDTEFYPRPLVMMEQEDRQMYVVALSLVDCVPSS